MKTHVWVLGVVVIGSFSSLCRADLRPERIHVAESRKTKAYIQEGLVTGGFGKVDNFIVKDIRWAKNGPFERIVVDLGGYTQGEETELNRPPYFQVALSPEENRMTLSLSGKAKLSFNSNKVIASFKKSKFVEQVTLLPLIEGVPWTCVFQLKPEVMVETFELGQPVRVILDLQPKKK